jgi:hypothetical protein
MEFNFQIHREKRFVHVALKGDMEYGHLHSLVNQLVSLRLLEFRKLYDARSMRPQFKAYDLQMLKVRLAPLSKTCVMGPSAIVAASEEVFGMFQMCEIIMGGVWPVHPCHSLREGMTWLKGYRPWSPAKCEAA